MSDAQEAAKETASLPAKLAWPLAQLPMLVGVAITRDAAVEHPWRTVALVVSYQGTLLLIRFLGLLQGPFLAKLAELAGQLPGAIVTVAKRLLSASLARYRRRLIVQYSTSSDIGLVNAARSAPSLEDVYVELRLVVAPGGLSVDIGEPPSNEPDHTIWEVLMARRPGVGIVVTGPPGSGKTTLLQHTVWMLAQGRGKRHGLLKSVPILLRLREQAERIAREGQTLTTAELAATSKREEALFDKALAAGRGIVLLDGLDEIADADARRATVKWVDKQILDYSASVFVVSSRPHGYLSAKLLSANVYQVQPLARPQIRDFLQKWYVQSELHKASPKQTSATRALLTRKAEEGANDLLERLTRTPALDALTVNPLLLRMIAIVHATHHVLPNSRVILYQEITQVLVERWRAAQSVEERLTGVKKLAVLRPLADHLMHAGKRDFSVDEVTQVLERPLRDIGWINDLQVTPRKGVEAFLSDINAESSLLVEREPGSWAFAHHCFQEFLTSWHWREGGRPAPWQKYVKESWWAETLRLYAAHADASAIVRSCLAIDSVETLALAADCLQENQRLDEELKAAVDTRIFEALESADAKAQDIASKVELHRKLAQTVRVSDAVRICMGLISNAEYQRFIDSLLVNGAHRQPDHWSSARFAAGGAREPVQGVRLRDAREFAGWVARSTGQRWRLPTREEHFETPIADVSVWCEENGVAWVSLPRDAGRASRWDLVAALEVDAAAAKLLQGVVGGDFPLDLAEIIVLATERALGRPPQTVIQALTVSKVPASAVPSTFVERQLAAWESRIDPTSVMAKHRQRCLEPALKLTQASSLLEMRGAARAFMSQVIQAAVGDRKQSFDGAEGARERLEDALLALQHVKSLDLPVAIRNGAIRLVREL